MRFQNCFYLLELKKGTRKNQLWKFNLLSNGRTWNILYKAAKWEPHVQYNGQECPLYTWWLWKAIQNMWSFTKEKLWLQSLKTYTFIEMNWSTHNPLFKSKTTCFGPKMVLSVISSFQSLNWLGHYNLTDFLPVHVFYSLRLLTVFHYQSLSVRFVI